MGERKATYVASEDVSGVIRNFIWSKGLKNEHEKDLLSVFNVENDAFSIPFCYILLRKCKPKICCEEM